MLLGVANFFRMHTSMITPTLTEPLPHIGTLIQTHYIAHTHAQMIITKFQMLTFTLRRALTYTSKITYTPTKTLSHISAHLKTNHSAHSHAVTTTTKFQTHQLALEHTQMYENISIITHSTYCSINTQTHRRTHQLQTQNTTSNVCNHKAVALIKMLQLCVHSSNTTYYSLLPSAAQYEQ